MGSTEGMRMSFNFLKHLIFTAAKNVCDDPSIMFNTVKGAKEALIKEVNRLVDEYANDPSNLLSLNLISNDADEPDDIKEARMTEALFGINTDFFNFDITEFIREMELIEEACETLGIPKDPKKGYVLKGDQIKKVADYINQRRKKM